MIGIHDAWFTDVRWSKDRRDLTLMLRGNWTNHIDLTLFYRGAVLSELDEWTLARAVRSHGSDVMTHELHQVAGGLIEHRIMESNGHWCRVCCEELRWTRTDYSESETPPPPAKRADRFLGGPLTPLLIDHGPLNPTRRSRLSWRVNYFHDRRECVPHRRNDREYLAMRRADLRKKLAAEGAASACEGA